MKRKSCSLRTLFLCVTQTAFVFALKHFASPVHLQNSERDTDYRRKFLRERGSENELDRGDWG
jgi:hypothetical protein